MFILRKILFSAGLVVSLSVNTALAVCLPAQTCAQVSELEDVPFGTYDFVSTMFQSNDFCPYVQDDDETNYVLTFTGSGAANAFEITNGTSDVAYEVTFSDDGAPFQNITTAVPVTPANANDQSSDCSVGGETGRVAIRIPAANLQFMTSGSYSGTLTFTMTPD